MDYRPRTWNPDADTGEWPVARPVAQPSRAWIGWLMLGTLVIAGSMLAYARIMRAN